MPDKNHPPRTPADQADWMYSQLESKRNVEQKDFQNHFQFNSMSDWSRSSHFLNAILHRQNCRVALEDRVLSIEGDELKPAARHNTELFKALEDYDAKQFIGRLVALELMRRQNRNVLLGSGSTVYHCGLAMRAVAQEEKAKGGKGKYRQQFWTVNIALAADLCSEPDSSPVGEINIPAGVLSAETFRYEAQTPEWGGAIVVVGADGCFYDKESKKAKLYANSGKVGYITNLVIKDATDTVICCLASRKLEFHDGEGQNNAPEIKAPLAPWIKKFLVTDKRPEPSTRDHLKNAALNALEDAGWIIITKPTDWRDEERGDDSQNADGATLGEGGPTVRVVAPGMDKLANEKTTPAEN